MSQPHFIVFANEKGGTGKSTTAVHTAIALAASGHRVGALDLDSRQRTMTRYLENRDATMRRLDKELPQARLRSARGPERGRRSTRRSRGLPSDADVIVIDTPGRDDADRPRRDPQGRHAGHADERQLRRPRPDRPGPPRELQDHQAELLRRADLEQPHRSAPRRPARASTGSCCATASSTSNRTICSRVGAALDELARRVGFRVIPGLGERVIYRELFPKGLTLLDLQQLGEVGIGHITARQELREMIAGLGIPGADEVEPDREPVSARSRLSRLD